MRQTGRRSLLKTGLKRQFEWENTSYDKGEDDPDPYVIWTSEVRGTAGGPNVVAHDLSNNRYGGVSWRGSALTNCQAGADCNQGVYLLVTTDSTIERGGRVMSLDSAQHMLEVYSSILESDDIDMLWPSTGSQANDQNEFEVSQTRGDQPQSATHELGHVLQMQQFDENNLTNDCSLGGSGHFIDVAEFESCATTEGWAGYVAAVSLWDPQNNSSAPARLGVDYVDATPLEPVCSDNAGIEGQVTKAFWDLDDDENEAAQPPSGNNDEKDSDTITIAERWAVFPNGTNNRDAVLTYIYQSICDATASAEAHRGHDPGGSARHAGGGRAGPVARGTRLERGAPGRAADQTGHAGPHTATGAARRRYHASRRSARPRRCRLTTATR